MHRVPEVIDCWYDSGSMPFAQFHYPFEKQGRVRALLPRPVHLRRRWTRRAAGFTRCWPSPPACSTGPALKNCIVLGHVQDKDGQKMSKHKGNVVNPWTR